MTGVVHLETRRDVLQPDPHKVVVRLCAGFSCTNIVTTHRVRQNINGRREYCSLSCYSRWSPAMRQVIARYPEYQQTPSGLEALIRDLRSEHGITGAAEILGFSRSTIGYWLKKLSTFRLFPAQSSDGILEILLASAERDGMDHAASLVHVDPKTLGQALARYQQRRQGAQAA